MRRLYRMSLPQSRLWYERDVCLSVRLSVSNVAGWIMITECNKKWKWTHDGIGYLHTEVGPDRSILWSRILLRNPLGYEKCAVLHFGGHNLRNGANYALEHKQEIAFGESNGTVCRRFTATRSVRNRVQKPSNSASVSIWKQYVQWLAFTLSQRSVELLVTFLLW